MDIKMHGYQVWLHRFDKGVLSHKQMFSIVRESIKLKVDSENSQKSVDCSVESLQFGAQTHTNFPNLLCIFYHLILVCLIPLYFPLTMQVMRSLYLCFRR